MGLKSYIRERLIAAVQYAVREEMKNERLISENREIPNGENSSEEIINRLDKQIERWTWERYKRTDKLFDEFEYEVNYELNKGIDRLERKVAMSTDNAQKQYIDKTDEKVKYWTGKRFEQTDKQIERWTWERYKRSEDKLLYVYKLQNQISELLFQEKKVPYIKGEKIRIVFLFQVASFWPSWESFYKACIEDDRFDVKFLFLDETVREKVQMKTAEHFLMRENINYINCIISFHI